MEPKARWSQWANIDGDWTATVGPFRLDVAAQAGWCCLSHRDPYLPLWEQKVATPCDVTDLMRLTESELARRLEKAAATMDGGELVAAPYPGRHGYCDRYGCTQTKAVGAYCEMHDEENRSRDAAVGWDVAKTSTKEPRFKVGDLVRTVYGGTVGTVRRLDGKYPVVVCTVSHQTVCLTDITS